MLSSLHHISEIAIISNSCFMILRNSRSLSKYLFKLLILMWYRENKFSRSFCTLQGTSAREKYGEFTSSYLSLKKFISGLLSSLFKIYWKAKGLKMFSCKFAVFLSGIFPRQCQNSFTKDFDFAEKLQEKLLFSAFSFSYDFVIDQNSIHTIRP